MYILNPFMVKYATFSSNSDMYPIYSENFRVVIPTLMEDDVFSHAIKQGRELLANISYVRHNQQLIETENGTRQR